MPKGFQSEGLPWTPSDQAFFKRNKAKSWYVRSAWQGEHGNLRVFGGLGSLLLEELPKLALKDPKIPTLTEVKILVLQIRPGERMRLPVLWWKGKDPDIAWDENPGDPDQPIRQTTVRALLARVREACPTGMRPEPVLRDNCDRCGVPFETGGIILGLTHKRTRENLSFCRSCAEPQNWPPEFVGSSVGTFVGHDAGTPEGKAKIDRATAAFKAMADMGLFQKKD